MDQIKAAFDFFGNTFILKSAAIVTVQHCVKAKCYTINQPHGVFIWQKSETYF